VLNRERDFHDIYLRNLLKIKIYVNMSYIFNFEQLHVWQDVRAMIKSIYISSRNFPDEEKYGLTAQIRRAAISVSSNISEGASRSGGKDQAYFYNISYASLMEVLSQLIIAFDLGYLDESYYLDYRSQIERIANKINALRQTALRR